MLGYEKLLSIREQIQRITYDTSDSNTASLNEAINRELQQVAASIQWPQLIRVDKSGLRDPTNSGLKTLEAGDEYCPLPASSARLLSLHHQSGVSGRTELEAMDPQRFGEAVGSRVGESGVPVIYRYVGRTAQISRAVEGAAVAFSNVGNNDLNGIEVTVRYRRALAFQQDERTKVTLVGAFSSGLTLGEAIAEGYSIEEVLIPATWVGDFWIEDGSNAQVVRFRHYTTPATTIATDKHVLSRQLIEVWPTPQADYPLTIHWYRDPIPLVDDDDAPEIPVSAYLVDRVAAVLLEQQAKHADAAARHASAARHLRAATGMHKQDAPRIAKPYGGNLLTGTGINY